MILVDSSVWIDFLVDRETPQTVALEWLLSAELDVGMGDLMLVEVLQGTRNERERTRALTRLSLFPAVQISDHAVAQAAACNYQALRALGVTPRKTIDTLIATRCIMDEMPLLYADRDFHVFVEHLGLRSALTTTGVN